MTARTTADDGTREVAVRSMVTYGGLSLGLAVAFFLAASLIGSFAEVARIGGAIWVFVLSMIVTMPLVTSWYKKRAR